MLRKFDFRLIFILLVVLGSVAYGGYIMIEDALAVEISEGSGLGSPASLSEVDVEQIEENLKKYEEHQEELENLPMVEKVVELPETAVENVKEEKGQQYWIDYINALEVPQSEKDWLHKIAWCESRYRNTAKNGTTSASGLLQYKTSTFASALKSGYPPEELGEVSIWNGKVQIWLALRHYRVHGGDAWECN